MVSLKTSPGRVVAWAGLGLGVVGGVMLLGGPPVWLLDWLASRHPGCLYRIPVKARMIALTLDDGPDPVTTSLILAELSRYDAHATFFLITDRIRNQERLVSQMVAGGHEIGNHFTQDRPGIQLTSQEFIRDLDEADRALKPFGPVRWARPGSGWYSQAMIQTLARKGYRCALGSVYPYDASIPSAGFATWYIRRNVRPGAILILHDGGARGRRTARILHRVLPWLQRQGFRVVSLSELAAQH